MGAMTDEQPRVLSEATVPAEATVVEVHGSRFLLEWLDLEVLAAAAALRLEEAAPRPA
jgi:hypothetical protein